MEENGIKRQPLLKIHYRAIELRYEGLDFITLGQKLTEEFPGVKNLTFRVRKWFCHNGKLEKDFDTYARQENERRRNQIRQGMQKVLELLPEKYAALLSRFQRNPFTGQIINDDNNKPIERLDMVTVATLKNIAEMMGFKMEPIDNPDGRDPIDRYFDKAEQEAQKLLPTPNAQ